MRTQKIQIILLTAALIIGQSWFVDLAQTIEIPLRKQPYYFSTLEFNFLYFFVFLPSILLSIPLGILLGKLRFSIASLILLTISFILSLGMVYYFSLKTSNNKEIIFLLRASLGLVYDGIIILQSLVIARYFKRHYELIMGAYFSLAYFVVAGTFSISPQIYDKYHQVYIVIQFGCIFAFISFLSGIFLFAKLWLLQQRIKQKQEHQDFIQIIQEEKNITPGQKQIQTQEVSQNLSSIKETGQSEADQFQLQHLKSISDSNNPYWLILVAIIFAQLSVISIIDNLNEGLVQTYNIPYVTAGFLLMVKSIITGVLLIIMGELHQKFPKTKRMSYVVISFLYFCGVTILYLLPIVKNQQSSFLHYFGVMVFLIIMALNTAILWSLLYSLVIYFIDEAHLGMAYGIIGTGIGIGECLGPILNAIWLDTTSTLCLSYKNLFCFYMILSIIPVLIAIWIKCSPDFDKIDEQIQQDKGQQQKRQISQKKSLNDQRENGQQKENNKYKYLVVALSLMIGILVMSIALRIFYIDANYMSKI